LNKKCVFFKSTKKLITINVIILITFTFIILIYNQYQSEKKGLMAVLQQKEDDKRVEKHKQQEFDREVEEKKLEEKVENKSNTDIILKENTKKDDFTEGKAIEIVSKIIKNKNPNLKVAYDHIQKRGGKNYFVIRVYDDMIDHISTLGWFYVQIETGKVFEWNLIEDILIPMN
jgi:hypothetical protein